MTSHVGCYITHLYKEAASCADIGTSLRKISGPEISGSFALNGIPFTSEAPVKQIETYRTFCLY